MKKLIALLAALILLCGCAANSPEDVHGQKEKLSVVTTIFPAYDFARQVFGDTAEVTMLLKPGMESHTYDPTARDIVKIDNCDLFIYNGGESDSWVEGILEAAEGVKALRMMDAVEVVEEEHSEGMEGSHEAEGESEYDEHIWTSPKNAADIVESIRRAAEEIAPENKEAYDAAASGYIEEINELDEDFSELFEGESRYFIFGDRFPLLYFFREYGLNYYAAFPGCGSETEPSARTISFLLDKLDENAVQAVFYIELSNHKLADTLAQDKGLSAAEFHTCHNITAEDFEAGETYVSLMKRNYEMLTKTLAVVR